MQHLGEGHVGHPVVGKVMIGKVTCNSTKWRTSGADDLHSNGAPQKERKDDDKSFLGFTIFLTTYGLARIDEIEMPELSYCYLNPFDFFDWQIVSAYITEYNWTTEDVGHLLATYPGFEHLKFKLINVSKNHVNQLGNITYEIFEIMQKRICLNGKQSSPMLFAHPIFFSANDDNDIGPTWLFRHSIDIDLMMEIRQAPYRVPYKQHE
uniref:Uncharacterized protein n=1 Tax=Romanomermis culicivorax TaxID=13658 RepID=A0A915JE53_ROMCU